LNVFIQGGQNTLDALTKQIELLE